MQGFPKNKSVKGVFSSVTKAFVEGIIPTINPTEDEIDQVLSFLNMTRGRVNCAYCGGPYTEWDHFRPLVKDKRPTGYITEINNLVPSCGKCNFSKGNKEWQVWFKSTARLSPTTRQVENLDQLYASLLYFEAKTKPLIIDFSKLEKHPMWIKYWESHKNLKNLISEINDIGLELKALIQKDFEFKKLAIPKTILTSETTKKDKIVILWDMLIKAATKKYVITYQEVADGLGIIARGVSPYLAPIEEFCEINNLPKLSCLVVSKTTQKLSTGYVVQNTSLEMDRLEVYDYNWSETKLDFNK